MGVVLVLLGFALNLAPIVVIAAGAAIGVLNILAWLMILMVFLAVCSWRLGSSGGRAR